MKHTISITLSVVALVIAIVGFWRDGDLSVQSLKIVDDQGRTRAALDTGEWGVQLRMWRPNSGEELLVLAVGNDGKAKISVRQENHGPELVLVSEPGEGAWLQLESDAYERLRLGTEDEPRPTLLLIADDEGPAPSVAILDAGGEVLAELTSE